MKTWQVVSLASLVAAGGYVTYEYQQHGNEAFAHMKKLANENMEKVSCVCQQCQVLSVYDYHSINVRCQAKEIQPVKTVIDKVSGGESQGNEKQDSSNETDHNERS